MKTSNLEKLYELLAHMDDRLRVLRDDWADNEVAKERVRTYTPWRKALAATIKEMEATIKEMEAKEGADLT